MVSAPLLIAILVAILIAVLFILQKRPKSKPYTHKAPIATGKKNSFIIRLQLLSMDPSLNALIELADAYKYGFYPYYKPDSQCANSLYRAANNYYNSSIALSKLNVANVLRQDTHGVSVPTIYADKSLQFHQGLFARQQDRMRQIRLNQQRQQRQQFQEQVPTPPQPVLQRQEPQIYADKQSVHDSAVTGIVKTNLQILQRQQQSSETVNKDTIKEALQSLNSNEIDTQTVNDVIDGLNTRSKHSRFDTTEYGALSTVFNNIQSINNDTVRSNALETLGKQLTSTIEGGKSVCSSGKIVQIAETLDGIDPNINQGRDVTVIQKELQTLAAKTRSDVLNTPDKLTKYNQSNQQIESEVRNAFQQKAKDIYITQLNIEPAIVKPLIDCISNEL